MSSSSSSIPYFTALNSPLRSRSDIVNAAKSLLLPLVPHFSPSRSTVPLGATATRYDEQAAGFEGYARPLWALGSLLAGGDDFEGTDLWIEGLRSGMDPQSEGYLGEVRDLDQRMVEMCPLGYALCVAGNKLWQPLSDGQKKNLEVWLGSVNGKEMPNTNWLWFRVFANLALKINGAKYSASKLEADMDHLDTFYRGDGWSNDGPEGYTQMDYYSGSYAIQLLQLLYAKLNGKDDPKRAEEYARRARLYAKDFVHYFDEEGRAITFGRSLTYRFAMAGFWSAVAFADVELDAPLSWGVVKGLLLRNLRWWSRQKNILTSQGTFNIGYCYPNQFISENYNSHGSTYWFMLSFTCLALPESHPFWQAEELPLPTNQILPTLAVKHPMHITVNKGGHTFLLSSGQRCHYPMRAAESKYGKFAYSSAFGYSVPTGGYFVQAIGGDNMLSLSDDEGETWKVRKLVLNARFEEYDNAPVLASSWRPWRDVEVETWLIPPTDNEPNWHLRAHHVKTGRDVKSSEGAFAMKGERQSDGRELDALQEGGHEGRHEGTDCSLAASTAGAVGIVELYASRHGKVLDEDANSNLVESRTVLPTLTADFSAGSDSWLVTAVYAVPSSKQDWRETWRSGWEVRPRIPEWLKKKMGA